MVCVYPTDGKTLLVASPVLLFTGLEFEVYQHDDVTTIIRAFLLASTTPYEGNLELSDYLAKIPQNDHYYRFS